MTTSSQTMVDTFSSYTPPVQYPTFSSYIPLVECSRYKRVALVHIFTYDDCPNVIVLSRTESVFLSHYRWFLVHLGTCLIILTLVISYLIIGDLFTKNSKKRLLSFLKFRLLLYGSNPYIRS